MKNIFRIPGVILIISIFLIHSCKKEEVPALTTSLSGFTATSATSGGTITDEGSSTIIARGVCWSTGITPTLADNKTTDGAGAGTFSSNITGLYGGTTYFVRAYATNSVGTGYGMAMSFTTMGQPPGAPTVTTLEATVKTPEAAQLYGTVNANYFSAIVTFEYGTTTNYGNTITATQSPVTGVTNTDVSAPVIGLTANITYHYRVKAVNTGGTTYGSDVTFTTFNNGGGGISITFNPNLTYGSVSDNDGNTYKTIQIGTQVWMAENLKTTRYKNGTAIPLVVTDDNATWSNLTTPGYCLYNDSRYQHNEATYKVTYGALYNWYTVSTGNLCPIGWHVPTDIEWTTLIDYIGGESVAGGKLKEAGITHWFSPNEGATNETGFTALPGGSRDVAYSSIGYGGYWWSVTEGGATYAWYRHLSYYDNDAGSTNYSKRNGHSVRCVRDY